MPKVVTFPFVTKLLFEIINYRYFHNSTLSPKVGMAKIKITMIAFRALPGMPMIHGSRVFL